MRYLRLLVFLGVLTTLLGAAFAASLLIPAPGARSQPPNPAAAPYGSAALGSQADALVIISTLDLRSFQEAIAAVRDNGGEVPQAYPPSAFVATLNPEVEQALNRHPAVVRIEKGEVEPASLKPVSVEAEQAAHVWNTVFRGIPDPIAASIPPGAPPDLDGPDFEIPPPELPRGPMEPGAPSASQTSEFMAGTVVYSVVFVESDDTATGNCSPADTETENWDTSRQNAVLSEISDGLAFWTSRSNRPSPLTFLLDNQGTRPTSCEPITRPGGSSGDEGKWIADVLTAMGFPATTGDYLDVAGSFADSRRTALGADWGYIIFVVDSLVDADGQFSSGRFANAWMNGPCMVMTYDNDGWGISRMNVVAAHETGHIFGALDEYASSECSTSDSWGYLNAANASCNNGGVTTDISIMGESSEQDDPAVDVSTSARDAIGWRNPAGTVVDVVRTSTVSLTPYSPDPTADSTPTYSASAGNTAFPPEGPRMQGGNSYGTAAPVNVSKVAGAEWNLDGGAWTSDGVIPSDGAFDEETDPYTFTPPSPLADGTYTFGTRSINNFGHLSSAATDILTVSGDCPNPGSVPWGTPPGDVDCDGFSNADEGDIGTDPNDNCPDDGTDDCWPPDFDRNTVINITDVFQVLPPYFGSSPPDPNYSVRRDLSPDGVINITDVFKVLPPIFGFVCTP